MVPCSLTWQRQKTINKKVQKTLTCSRRYRGAELRDSPWPVQLAPLKFASKSKTASNRSCLIFPFLYTWKTITMGNQLYLKGQPRTCSNRASTWEGIQVAGLGAAVASARAETGASSRDKVVCPHQAQSKPNLQLLYNMNIFCISAWRLKMFRKSA